MSYVSPFCSLPWLGVATVPRASLAMAMERVLVAAVSKASHKVHTCPPAMEKVLPKVWLTCWGSSSQKLQQLVAGVLLPGNQPTSQQAAPAPETTRPTGGELKEIRDLLLSLKEEKNVTASNGPSETPMALTQTLAQIKAELKQMSGIGPTEDKTPFATELAALQAQVAGAAKRHRHANVSSSGPSQGNRMAKLRTQTVNEASTVKQNPLTSSLGASHRRPNGQTMISSKPSPRQLRKACQMTRQMKQLRRLVSSHGLGVLEAPTRHTDSFIFGAFYLQ